MKLKLNKFKDTFDIAMGFVILFGAGTALVLMVKYFIWLWNII